MKNGVKLLMAACIMLVSASCIRESMDLGEKKSVEVTIGLGLSDGTTSRAIASEIPEEFYYPYDSLYLFNDNNFFEFKVYADDLGRKYVNFVITYTIGSNCFEIQPIERDKPYIGKMNARSYFTHTKDVHYNSTPTKNGTTPDGEKLMEVHGIDHYRSDLFRPTYSNGNFHFMDQIVPLDEYQTTVEVPMNRLTSALLPQLALFKKEGNEVLPVTADEYAEIFGADEPEISSYLYNYGTKFWLQKDYPVVPDNNDDKGFYELTDGKMKFGTKVPVLVDGKTIETYATVVGSKGYAYLFAVPFMPKSTLDMVVDFGDKYVWTSLSLAGKELTMNDRKTVTIYCDIADFVKSIESRSGARVAVPIEEVDFAGGNIPSVFYSWK